MTENANFDSCTRELQKFSCKIFKRKTYFTQFQVFACNILSRIVGIYRENLPFNYYKPILNSAELFESLIIKKYRFQYTLQ